MSEKLIKLCFNTPLHIGLEHAGIGYEETAYSIHSDQFFSAICNAFLDLYGENELEKFLKNIEDNNFKATDLFPFVKDKYYVPTPLYPPHKETQEQQKKKKFTRKNRPLFICVDDFENYLAGQHNELIENEELKNNIEKEIIIQNIPHVAIKDVSEKNKEDENYSQGEFYHYATVTFPENSGLWCLINTNDDIFIRIKACIKYLGDEGIGGKRSWGYGQFISDFDCKDEPLKKLYSEDKEVYYLLSTLIPEDAAKYDFNNTYYELIPRRGWLYDNRVPTGEPKKTIYAFASGSVFEEEIKGKALVNIHPDDEKKCYRLGQEYFIKIKVSRQ
ncbi:MAG: type III-A CRISPR-associated RAMP protein Csm4 [bacterium]